MTALNYHHLLYFGAVARHGSVAKAAAALHLTQPAVSSQIRTLSRQLKHPLLERRGRGVVPTEVGRIVARYADEIAILGRAMQDTLAGRTVDRLTPLRIGVVDALPKLLVHQLLEPVMVPKAATRLVVYEEKLDRLLGDLVVHELDVVFADAPAPSAPSVRTFSHLVLESAIEFFAAPGLARKLHRKFPRSLDGAPVLLPTVNTSLRRGLDAWFDSKDIRPQIVAEIEDSAVLKVFGQQGAGVFAAPAIVGPELTRQYRVKSLGTADRVRETVYAITVERRISHPGVRAITDHARAGRPAG